MKRVLLAVLTTLLAASAATPAPASAETLRGRDRSHDVRHSSRGERAHLVDRADGDILRYRFTYTDRRFSAVVRFRDLRRDVPSRYLSVNLRYESDVQLEYLEAEVEVSPTDLQGRAHVNGDACPAATSATGSTTAATPSGSASPPGACSPLASSTPASSVRSRTLQ
ncbi:hypothetical protein [Nocardioides rubriscoriae]|uniref:hypothetical protein n=1 Tax=Nocardioides rubriscoriae TaxID=642762 RepID=UPI0011DF3C50|nr:hypothetical protein [Nocardioides rubriscoriae]